MSNPSKAKGTKAESAVMANRGPKPMPLEDRLKRRLVKTDSGCHEWEGATKRGYGVTIVGSRADRSRRRAYAHRIAWEIAYGPIPDGMFVCHACDNPPCCNPEHLFLGTPADNTADMDRKGRRVNSPHPGALNGRALLDREDVAVIRRRYAAGESQVAIAADYPVSRTTIGYIVRGETWGA